MPIEIRLETPGSPTRDYQFNRVDIVFGRHPFNDVVLTDGALAGRHGRLSVSERGQLRYEDLGGPGGSTIERSGESFGMSGSTTSIAEGDRILLGQSTGVAITVLRFEKERQAKCEIVPFPRGSVGELFGRFPGARGRALVWTLSTLLESESLPDAAPALAGLIDSIVESRAAELVVPHGELFRDQVVALGGDLDTAPTDWLGGPGRRSDSQALIDLKVSRSIEIRETPSEDSETWVEVLLPVVTSAASVAAYFRLLVQGHPPAEHLQTLGAAVRIAQSAVLSVIDREARRRENELLKAENDYFRTRARRHYLFKELITDSVPMKELYRDMHRVLDADAPVLVVGEAGSGKKMVGRALHHLGPRTRGIFIAQNCGDLASSELGQELFGVASEGSASARRSLFELAAGGTLFLDEVDRASMKVQAQLVRAIREREVRREGDEVARSVNVRVLAATHADLDHAVREGRFRRDLWQVLTQHQLRVPPLRDRSGDILPLAKHFIEKYSGRYGLAVTGLSRQAEGRLLAHDWAGNVRELQVVIETAVMKARSGPIEPRHLDLVPPDTSP